MICDSVTISAAVNPCASSSSRTNAVAADGIRRDQVGMTQHGLGARRDGAVRRAAVEGGGERFASRLVGEARAVMRDERRGVVQLGDAQSDRETFGRRQTAGIGGIEKHGVRRLRAGAHFRASGAQLVQRRALGNAQHGVDHICGEAGHAACSPFEVSGTDARA